MAKQDNLFTNCMNLLMMIAGSTRVLFIFTNTCIT